MFSVAVLTNDHRFSLFKQRWLILSQSCRSRVRGSVARPGLLLTLHKLNCKHQKGVLPRLLPAGSGDPSSIRLLVKFGSLRL